MDTDILVLLVEDEALIMLATQDALEAGGYSVVTAASGLEAAEVLERRIEEISGLITDIRVGPGPDGWALARQARVLKPELPVVYTSGDSAHEWTASGVPKSVMIQKPYASAQTLTAISGLLNDSNGATAS